MKLETLRLLRRTVPRREGADPVSANWEGPVEDLQESTLESTVTRARDQTSIVDLTCTISLVSDRYSGRLSAWPQSSIRKSTRETEQKFKSALRLIMTLSR